MRNKLGFSSSQKHLLLCAILAGGLLSLGSPLLADDAPPQPSYRIWSGKTQKLDGYLTAQTRAILSQTVAATDTQITIAGKTGTDRGGILVAFRDMQAKPMKDADGKAVPVFNIHADDQRVLTANYPDSVLIMTGARYYVRPNMNFYKPDQAAKIAKGWETMEAASAHAFTLQFRRVGDSLQVWIDGDFAQEFKISGTIGDCQVTLSPGASVSTVSTGNAPDNAALSMAVEEHARAGELGQGKLQLDADAKLPDGMRVPTGQVSGIAVAGLGTIPGLASGELESRFTWRNATDNLPEQRMFSVPLATYSDAYVLCASSQNPAQESSFTFRVTRYGSSRGDAIADTEVHVPTGNGAGDANVRQVGSVNYGPGGAKTTPLWLIKVPIKNGQIQDLIFDDAATSKIRKSANMGTSYYLDVELLDPLRDVDKDDVFPPSLQPTDRQFRPGVERSAVTVYSVLMQKAPATLEVRASTDFQVFYKCDNANWLAKIAGRVPGTYNLAWDYADVDGKIVTSGKKAVTVTATQPDQTVTVPVVASNGWYATRFVLSDAKGQTLTDYRGAFVFLPPDTRKAGFESPFGTWWFHWAHGGEPNIERVGPLLERAGLRHTILPDSLPEAITSKYKVTAWAVPWHHSKITTLAEKLADHEAFVKDFLSKWPSVTHMLFWHESGSGGAAFPSEMWGEAPPPEDEKVKANWDDRIAYITPLAQFMRANYPNVKLQYGNDGNSLGIVAGLLRRKYPRELIDSFGTENVGQTIMPEKPTPDGLQAAWYQGQTAAALGYGDVPLSGCFEWMNRRDKTLGPGMQAEWYIRDCLHALAYGFTMIAPGSIHDAGNGYFFSLWGDGGFTQRYPDMVPKPAYAAIATLTTMVDGAKFQRTVPTGSTSLYVAEFKKGASWLYAVWTIRGNRDATLRFADAAPRTITDLYGRETAQAGASLALKAGPGAQYITSNSQIASVAAGATSFPLDVVPEKPFIVDAMDNLNNWTIAPDPNPALERVTGKGSNVMPHRTKGNFDLKQVVDKEKGACLELDLKPGPPQWVGTHEYAELQLKTPIVGPGPYGSMGVWVKGNSSWGDVMWELTNAKGGKWLTQGIWMDWRGLDAPNYDGWNFLSLPLQKSEDWHKDVTITGLAVTIPRNTLYLTKMVPVTNLTLRFKDLSLF